MHRLPVLVVLLSVLATAWTDSYRESLSIKPLNDGKVLTHFKFLTVWDQDVDGVKDATHYDVFPMIMGQYMAEYGVQELHFSLAKGLWNYRRWGYPVRDSMPGAELWIWFQAGIKDRSKSWQSVSNLLSGQFCASLNFAENTVTVQPELSFRPEGLVDKKRFADNSIFYAAVPHETVCTENLTPFKKLLPCFAKSGLASLISANHAFDSNYFSMAVDMRTVCRTSSTPCNQASIELTQTVTLVLNPAVHFEGKQSWSFYKLFGSSFRDVCPLATSTTTFVDTSRNESTNPHILLTSPDDVMVKKMPNGEVRSVAVYDLEKLLQNATHTKPVNLGAQYRKEHTYGPDVPPALLISRSVTGYGVFSGGIVSRITNNLPTAVRVLYMDVIPWYLRIFTHTLKVTAGGDRVLRPERMFYRPANDRIRPHHLELVLTLPPASVTQIEMEFDRSFLKWTEYPPDANHGVYAGSAILTARLDDSLNMTVDPGTASYDYHHIRIHSQSLLIYLPTPDFSMPYNVICLVSTAVSLAFGPIHNLTTRAARVAYRVVDGANQSLFSKIKKYFSRKWSDGVTADVSTST